MKLITLPLLIIFLSGSCLLKASPSEKPNIVYILTDDLGYGDVHILNPERGKIPTPNLDRLAKEGMIFTDAHTASSVCTPSRYGILTGRYCWRTTLQSGVLMGSSKPLISDDRMTVPSFLKSQGYYTGMVGKWHLGMDMAIASGKGMKSKIDFSKPITHGPMSVGFDYYYGVSASEDMPPYVYIQNDKFTSIPSKETPGGHEKYAFYRGGPIADDFVIEQVVPHLTDKAVEFIRNSAKNKEKPFFLYFALTSPHTPIIPTAEFKGKTSLGPYADYVFETDAMVGKVMAAIQEAGIASNTLIVFTSDNGCSRSANFKFLESEGHYPSAQYRGMKADVYDGGHRVPFIMRWPDKIKAGSQCDKPVGLTDMLATCADLFHQKLPDNAGEDSISILPEMLGQTGSYPQHEALVHHSIFGNFAIRDANWKLELCPGSGGWSDPKPGSKEEAGLPPIQLYDLSKDVGEKTNIQAQHPDVVKRLTSLLENYVESGRSTPGTKQSNAVPVKIFKAEHTDNKEHGGEPQPD